MGTPSFEIAVGKYAFSCVPAGMHLGYDVMKGSAQRVDEFRLDEAGLSSFAVRDIASGKTVLLVAMSCPSAEAAFYPSALFVEETSVLFYGAGERVLAYTLDPTALLWEDCAHVGLWGWSRHGDVVVMMAELELAAFDLRGNKLWTTFVEPPWTYDVDGDAIHLDVMGKKSVFSIHRGPDATAYR